MRLVHLGDNPKKKTFMYIPYTSCHHQLGVHNTSCPELLYYYIIINEMLFKHASQEISISQISFQAGGKQYKNSPDAG